MSDPLQSIINPEVLAKLPDQLSYETCRELMVHKETDIRQALALHGDTPEEILYFLAKDENPEVRAAVAQNAKTPRQADYILSKDLDPRIRHQLVNKIGRIMPDLSSEAKDVVIEVTADILKQLAHDEVEHVRGMLSEVIKDLPNVPHEVAQILANDTSLTVAEPILQFSPVLSDTDLLDIINTHPLRGIIEIISKRQYVSENVSGAIVDSGNSQAILNLLENETSQISEDSMDQILETASSEPKWHAPLVHRPALSKKTVMRLTDFVAMQLLDELQKRTDLDDDILIHLTQAVETKIIEEANKPEELDPALEAMKQAGTIEDQVIDEALKTQDSKKIVDMIAAVSDIPKNVVESSLTSPRPKSICALCYKAGISAKSAVKIQTQIARLPSSLIVSPNEDGSYPISPNEMAEILEELE